MPKHDKLNVTSSMTYGSETQPPNSDDAITEGTLVLKAKFGTAVWFCVWESYFSSLLAIVGHLFDGHHLIGIGVTCLRELITNVRLQFLSKKTKTS